MQRDYEKTVAVVRSNNECSKGSSSSGSGGVEHDQPVAKTTGRNAPHVGQERGFVELTLRFLESRFHTPTLPSCVATPFSRNCFKNRALQCTTIVYPDDAPSNSGLCPSPCNCGSSHRARPHKLFIIRILS